MSKTKIEWCDYTINPVKGLCPMACPYCYARAMYKRFKWDPDIRFVPETFIGLGKEPKRIFVGSTMELFGDWVKDECMEKILRYSAHRPWHTFIFLTKQPQNLRKWSPFPDNCWVGVSAANDAMAWIGEKHLSVIEAKVKFLSIEPLLKWDIETPAHEYCAERLIRGLDWLIIGQQTPVSKSTAPKVEWIREIVEAADKAGVPVFLKDNLAKLLPCALWTCDGAHTGGEGCHLRQEFPDAK
jgi:protein gp37